MEDFYMEGWILIAKSNLYTFGGSDLFSKNKNYVLSKIVDNLYFVKNNEGEFTHLNKKQLDDFFSCPDKRNYVIEQVIS